MLILSCVVLCLSGRSGVDDSASAPSAQKKKWYQMTGSAHKDPGDRGRGAEVRHLRMHALRVRVCSCDLVDRDTHHHVSVLCCAALRRLEQSSSSKKGVRSQPSHKGFALLSSVVLPPPTAGCADDTALHCSLSFLA